MKPIASLRVIHDDIGERTRTIAHEAWPCRKGCDACCRSLHSQPVVTEAEWLLLKPELTEDMRKRILSAEGKLCPLLDEKSGACRVYEARPVACRTYGFYADREGGLYCPTIEEMTGLDAIVWGNGEAIERRLDALGARRTLAEWVFRNGKLRSSDPCPAYDQDRE